MTLKGTFGEYVVIDPVKLAEWQRSSNGPTVRFLIEQGELVKKEAVRLAPVWKDPHDPLGYAAAQREKRGRKAGQLRDSIVKRIVDIDGLPAVIVGSEDPIALYAHEGTEPHAITAKRAPALFFWWAKAGVYVRVPKPGHVNHPGTKPNRFLVKALSVVGGRLI